MYMTAPILPEALHIAILAGGRSTRMGRDKRFIAWEGVTLLDHVVSIASTVSGADSERVFLCGDIPGRACLKDETPGLGPLSGILSAVTRARENSRDAIPALLVIPVDMPRLRPDLLERLVAVLNRSPAVTAIHFGGFELPCAIRCTPEVEESLRCVQAATEKGARSIRGLLARIGAATIVLPEEWANQLLNLNSPADLKSASNGGVP